MSSSLSYKPARTLLVVIGAAVLSGCANTTPKPTRTMDQIYEESHRAGADDAADILRAGLKAKAVYGVGDPYIPIRHADVVVPVFKPAHVNPVTGRRVSGTWEHTVLEPAHWETR